MDDKMAVSSSVLMALRDLVKLFDDDEGLPQAVFEATSLLVLAVCGRPAQAAFTAGIDAIDDRYYFKDEAAAEKIVLEIFGW